MVSKKRVNKSVQSLDDRVGDAAWRALKTLDSLRQFLDFAMWFWVQASTSWKQRTPTARAALRK